MADAECRRTVGPIWKLDGETCMCVLPAGHVDRADGPYGADHVCSCGTWFTPDVGRPDIDTQEAP